MNLVELLIGISLFTLVMQATLYTIPLFQERFDEARVLREELSQVEHVLQIITRSVQQAGYHDLLPKAPIVKTRETAASSIAPSTSVRVFPQAILTTDFDTTSTASQRQVTNMRRASKDSPVQAAQSSLAQGRKTDALLIEHATYGHFDCLGRKITEKRTHQGLARIGFFVQFRGNAKSAKGFLMCQSLTNKGHPQNDVILSGVHGFQVELHEDLVTLELTMDSKRRYVKTIALQNSSHLITP